MVGEKTKGYKVVIHFNKKLRGKGTTKNPVERKAEQRKSD